jgi:outer membrane lipoprotein SlyB
MSAIKLSTAVGVFHNRIDAQEAIQDLVTAGFARDKIGMLVRDDPPPEAPAPEEARTVEGGVAGALTGGSLGAVLGAAATFIPGVGPVIGAGLLIAAVGGAAAGAVAGGLMGVLLSLGISKEEARHFENEVQAGRTLVTVQVDERHDEAVAILRGHGAVGLGSPLL